MNLKKINLGLKSLYFINIRRDPTTLFPPLMSIKLTDRCNYKCITCDHPNVKNINDEMNGDQLKKLIVEFKDLGGYFVRFTGGEIYLKDELNDLILFTKSLNLSLALATNGSLLSEDKIAFIKDSRVDHVTISLHGDREVHNKIVGINGSWGRIDRSIKKMIKERIPVDIAFTITRENINKVEYIVKYANKLNIKVSFNIMDTKPYFFRKIDRSIVPTLNEMKLCSTLLLDLKARYPRNINGSKKMFKLMPLLIQDSRMFYYYCSRVTLEVDIDSYGNVYNCWAMPSVGNLKSTNLESIFLSMLFRERRRKGFQKVCPGCTCGYGMDVALNIFKRLRSNHV